jgi:octaprenyl-diphosphate synthase
MSTEASTTFTTLYAPIQSEIDSLETFLETAFAREEPFIVELFSHVRRYHGKRIRPALLLLVGRLSSPASDMIRPDQLESLVKMAAVVELIHTATLVHDDILDSAELRRNVETLHQIWGERVAILMGDFIYSRAFSLSTEVDDMAPIMSHATNLICEGELMQIRHRFHADLNEDVYLDIIRKKTAILYAVACEVGARIAGLGEPERKALYEFGLDLGMAFQIIDDCMDYAGDERVVGKSLGTDLHQGKVTLPLIHLLRAQSESGRKGLLETLGQPMARSTEDQIAAAIRGDGTNGASSGGNGTGESPLHRSFARAQAYIDSARAAVAGFPLELRESLDLVSDYVLRRRS